MKMAMQFNNCQCLEQFNFTGFISFMGFGKSREPPSPCSSQCRLHFQSQGLGRSLGFLNSNKATIAALSKAFLSQTYLAFYTNVTCMNFHCASTTAKFKLQSILSDCLESQLG